MTLFSCQIDYSPAECDKSSPMLLETFLNKLKERWVECTTYTRCSQKFNIGQSLIPPIMAPSIRRSDVLNTEAQKRSVVLKSMNNKCQGAYFFLSLSIVYQYFENPTSTLIDFIVVILYSVHNQYSRNFSGVDGFSELNCKLGVALQDYYTCMYMYNHLQPASRLSCVGFEFSEILAVEQQ